MSGVNVPDRRKYDRNPDTLVVLSVCATIVGAMVVLASPPGSLVEAWGQTWAMVWCVITGSAFIIALAGVLWRDAVVGWAIELSGRVALATGLAVYFGVLTASLTNSGSALVAGLVLAIAASSGWRARDLFKRVRSWSGVIGIGNPATPADPPPAEDGS